MFSVFGRTGAPQKWGPHMRTKKNFCNVPTHRNCPKVIEVIDKIKILCGTGVSVQRSPACSVSNKTLLCVYILQFYIRCTLCLMASERLVTKIQTMTDSS